MFVEVRGDGTLSTGKVAGDPNMKMPESPASAAAREPVLEDYAAVGDGRSIALIDSDGRVAWWCVPNIDSDPLFDCLVDPAEGGFFTLAPVEVFEVERRYRSDSNVLVSEYRTASGRVRVTDSMNSTFAGRLPWCELARRIEGLEGRVTMQATMVFGTRANTISPWLQLNEHGCIFHAGPVLGLFLRSPSVESLREEDRTMVAQISVSTDEHALVAVVAGEDQPLGVPHIANLDQRIELTDQAWKAWAQGLRYDGPYREVVRRSALILKLLLFSPTGAIAAAATTSLPERLGGEKNWDYRYAWVRDAGYTLAAFIRLDVIPESQAALQWLLHRIGEDGARVCYRLDGGIVPPEETIDVPGYRESRPVRVGNRAASQRQHGVYGDIFLAAGSFVSAGNVLDQHSAFVLTGLADECAERWRMKDAGMWELEEQQHFTMSKISCHQALTQAVALAEAGHLPSTCVSRWRRERERISDWIDAQCWSEAKQAYSFYTGTDRLDASLVLAVRFGFDNRKRLSLTVDAIRAELADGPWIYRYSGADAEEGAFIACTFWLVEAYAELGRMDEARALMDEALAGLPDGVGLLAEMIDPKTRSFLGNLPQGLSHLALIHAALSIDAGTAS